jgi:hypothetical protein
MKQPSISKAEQRRERTRISWEMDIEKIISLSEGGDLE